MGAVRAAEVEAVARTRSAAVALALARLASVRSLALLRRLAVQHLPEGI
jgi:hypothetical protein